jgi:hypothetical protein
MRRALPIQITFIGRRRELEGPAGCTGIEEIELSDFGHFEDEFSSKHFKNFSVAATLHTVT